jgi:hypothetical protein
MLLSCPRCAAAVPVQAGEAAICGACGHRWTPGVVLRGAGSGPWEFEVQLAPGDAPQGPYDRLALRELLYVGRLTGDERVRVPGDSQWSPIAERPEFLEVLDLLGKRPGAGATRHSIAGWRKAPSVPAAAPAPAPGAPRPAAAPAPRQAAAAAPPPAPPAVRPVLLVAAAVLAVVLLGGLAVAFG